MARPDEHHYHIYKMLGGKLWFGEQYGNTSHTLTQLVCIEGIALDAEMIAKLVATGQLPATHEDGYFLSFFPLDFVATIVGGIEWEADWPHPRAPDLIEEGWDRLAVEGAKRLVSKALG